MEQRDEKRRDLAGRSLINLVFSWSLKDILNQNFYKTKVKKIPETFDSTTEYLTAFIPPLVEETHADLYESLTTLSGHHTHEISSAWESKDYRPPGNLFYDILVKRAKNPDDSSAQGYELEGGDLIALTDVRPKSIHDLNTPRRPYHLAYIYRVGDDDSDEENESEEVFLSILSSKPIVFEQDSKRRSSLFAVYLVNLTTSIRIWGALNLETERNGGHLNLIRRVLHPKPTDCEDCSQCSAKENNSDDFASLVAKIKGSNLNQSQADAVLNCVSMRECCHQNYVKLIWGPPGTGKTKTVGFLLYALLNLKCRTVTCAPTNIAVVGMAKRFVNLVLEFSEYDRYGHGIGDIVLLGNKKRMKIDEHDDVLDIFLGSRAKILQICFHPNRGWTHNIRAMTCLLEEPHEQYRRYLIDCEKEFDEIFEENEATGSEDRKGSKCVKLQDDGRKIFTRAVVRALRDNEKKRKQKDYSKDKKKQNGSSKSKKAEGPSEERSNEDQDVKKRVKHMTFDKFVMRRFLSAYYWLKFCIPNLCTHMPTSIISLEVAKNMMNALDLLSALVNLLHSVSDKYRHLEQFFNDNEELERQNGAIRELKAKRREVLDVLKSLPDTFHVPYFSNRTDIKSFCLNSALLVFCTASGTTKLDTAGERELLVIDEAAQLKECESAIPFQLPRLGHAVLVGDERQLPAMVRSKISANAEFGRSMFERLVLRGYEKHLLNVQYRMHPSISSFPNKKFYDGRILDAPNVQGAAYEKRFLRGSMFGSYSFINIPHAKEEFNNGRSPKNMIEAVVVSELVANLHKEYVINRRKISIGVISPYKAQVYAIEQELRKSHNLDEDSSFHVSVRSVDGFQGGEEDLVIISTVRCNRNGSIGFLSNCQRSNVALTRARHCLWILGNESTLINSCSIWKDLVNDAKSRGCFYHANEDGKLAQAIIISLMELQQFDVLHNLDSLLFRNGKWKVTFNDDFWKSMEKIKNREVHKQVLSLMESLSSGWRQHNYREKKNLEFTEGNASQCLEVYTVSPQKLNLVWSIDIIEEGSFDVQALKIWDVLPSFGIPKLASDLDIVFGNYTVNKMNRCRQICREGSIVLPMKWPCRSRAVSSERHEIATHHLEKPSSSFRSQYEAVKQITRLMYETALFDSGSMLSDLKDFASSSYDSVESSLNVSPDAVVEEEDDAEEAEVETEAKEPSKEDANTESSDAKDEL